MRGETVAGKEQIHVMPLDQFLQMFGCSGMDNGRAADDENLLLLVAGAF